GGSFSYNNGSAANKWVYGFFAGGNYGRFTLFGEVDFVKDDLGAVGTTDKLAWIAEMDALIVKGLNFKLNYQWLDPERSVPSNNPTRLVTGLEWYPVRFLHTSLFYRMNDDIPQNETNRADQLFYEMHFFF